MYFQDDDDVIALWCLLHCRELTSLREFSNELSSSSVFIGELYKLFWPVLSSAQTGRHLYYFSERMTSIPYCVGVYAKILIWVFTRQASDLGKRCSSKKARIMQTKMKLAYKLKRHHETIRKVFFRTFHF